MKIGSQQRKLNGTGKTARKTKSEKQPKTSIELIDLPSPLPAFVSEGVIEGQFKCLVLVRHKNKVFSIGAQADTKLIRHDRKFLDNRLQALADAVVRTIET